MQPLVSAMSTFRKAFVNAIVKSLIRGKTLIQAILAYWVSPLVPSAATNGEIVGQKRKSLQDFLKDAEAALLGPISGDGLVQLSENLRTQFIEGLKTNKQCMLPSYSHQLPLGEEAGQFVALDVGGSTLRVALVELRGREVEESKQTEILSMRNFRIGKDIKDLEGMEFFFWMATKIGETLAAGLKQPSDKVIPAALAWSFPIE